MQQLSPPALAALLQQADPPPLLLDVREPWEFALCHLAGAQLLPMRQVPAAVGRQAPLLDPDTPLVVICHHGIRSQQVARFLEHQGFTRVMNLQGGVDRWAREIDPGMATY